MGPQSPHMHIRISAPRGRRQHLHRGTPHREAAIPICTSAPPHREAGGSTFIAAPPHREAAIPICTSAPPHREAGGSTFIAAHHTARLAAAKRSNYSITAGEHSEPAERTPSLHLRPHGGRTHRGEGIDMPVPPTRRMELATRQPCTSTRRRHVRTLLPHRYSPLGA